MDPFVTLLEVHKLMYFMQEAGEPLRLQYAKAPYGPYAENLRHVLHAGRRPPRRRATPTAATRPDKQLELVPGAVKDAESVPERTSQKRVRRFDRVGELVEGFETPFGLELLATVHWVATRENATSAEDAAAKVYAWNDRKKRFSPRQIGIASRPFARRGG